MSGATDWRRLTHLRGHAGIVDFVHRDAGQPAQWSPLPWRTLRSVADALLGGGPSSYPPRSHRRVKWRAGDADGRHVVSASEDKTLTVWALDTSACCHHAPREIRAYDATPRRGPPSCRRRAGCWSGSEPASAYRSADRPTVTLLPCRTRRRPRPFLAAVCSLSQLPASREQPGPTNGAAPVRRAPPRVIPESRRKTRILPRTAATGRPTGRQSAILTIP